VQPASTPAQAALGADARLGRQLQQGELTDAPEYFTGFSMPTTEYLMLPVNNFRFAASNVPDYWDWREQGVLTPVKDQGLVRANAACWYPVLQSSSLLCFQVL
jgi:C1A family cysteine protease